MYRMLGRTLVFTGILATSGPAAAQTFEILGTRAAGMAGAFVAVADDASAIYWNPAGLASGAFFSILFDWSVTRVSPDDEPEAGSQSSAIISLASPALGLGYYRLRSTALRLPDLSAPPAVLDTVPAPAVYQVDTLITHHTGVTLVQSLTDGIAVAATLKLVRGIAASDLASGATRDDVLDDAGDLIGRAGNAFDADLGVIATVGRMRAGLSVRNATQPGFDAPSGRELRLERQIRAGVALFPRDDVVVAADLDLRAVPGPVGEVRDLAIGAEARIVPRVFVRSGVRLNTAGDQPGGRAPVLSVGGSYAVLSSLFVDAQATAGSEAGGRAWGVAGRVVF
jgi:hypothetical protein